MILSEFMTYEILYYNSDTILEKNIKTVNMRKISINSGVETQITRSVLKCKIHRVNLSILWGKG